MGWCTDKSTNYLKSLGYNVVSHPREGITPLTLVGRQNGVAADLGPLAGMLVQPPPAAPAEETDVQAANINGEQSSKLDFAVGVNVLGALIGAMGGNLGVDLGYTNAEKISFVYESVSSDKVDPLAISNFLEQGTFNPGGPLIQEYVLGNGSLFVISETVKSTKFTVKFERSNGVEAKVDVPVIEKVLGGKISVSASGETNGSVTFDGKKPLVFGFRCLELGVLEGQMRLTLARPEPFPLETGTAPAENDFAILTDGQTGLLNLATG